MAKKNFLKGAVKHPGLETKLAKAHGMSVAQYAAANKHDKGKAGERARFALEAEQGKF